MHMAKKVIVYHGGYGCETGCCGHWVELQHEDGTSQERFEFGHPENTIEEARALVRSLFGEEHVKDLDWENCRIIEDCNG